MINEGTDAILQLFRKRNQKIRAMVMNNGFKQSMFLNPSTFTSIMNPTSPTTTFRSIDNQFNDMVFEMFHRYFPHLLSGVWGW